jgi:hypothetical protein
LVKSRLGANVCSWREAAIRRPLDLRGSPSEAAERYNQPRSPNAERSTPGGAYHPAEP